MKQLVYLLCHNYSDNGYKTIKAYTNWDAAYKGMEDYIIAHYGPSHREFVRKEKLLKIEAIPLEDT